MVNSLLAYSQGKHHSWYLSQNTTEGSVSFLLLLVSNQGGSRIESRKEYLLNFSLAYSLQDTSDDKLMT